MDYFNYQGQTLFAEGCQLSCIADKFDTPCYVYSKATIERHWKAFDDAAKQHPHLICYAVKANSNLAVLNVLARLGSGFDIVSGGELKRVIQAGGDTSKVVFSGVGKTRDEIAFALAQNIKCFNVESPAELERISQVASELKMIARVSIRVNPDVDANTHPYISTGLKANKFGIEREQALSVYQHAATLPGLSVVGIDCHIGSQLTDVSPFVDALDRLLVLVDELASIGIVLQHIDLGGGLGVTYDKESPPQPSDYVAALSERLQGRETLEVIFEPGRAIVANAGVLLTRVEFLKQGQEKNFAIVDAAMNDLLRPSLYTAWQDIIPIQQGSPHPQRLYDVVGPVCETGDFLGKDRSLAISEGDVLAIRSAGAYGFVMSSNYNSRCRVAEVMVDGCDSYLVRKREEVEQLWQGESVLPS